MKVTIDEHGALELQEVFSGVAMKTTEGDKIWACMRDDTLEINVMPQGVHTGNWWRVNMQAGTIEKLLASTEDPPCDTACSGGQGQ